MKLNLGQPVPCPHCDHNMMLTTDEERERGWCIYCGMTTHKHLSGFKLITDTEQTGRPSYDDWDQQAENEWDGVDERIWD